ncbi:MAG: CAP domain-containing protein [Deltaproteobacteria bacterium]|nr:CAP domain-containing protein [Deltaproteobacteria bacterium]
MGWCTLSNPMILIVGMGIASAGMAQPSPHPCQDPTLTRLALKHVQEGADAESLWEEAMLEDADFPWMAILRLEAEEALEPHLNSLGLDQKAMRCGEVQREEGRVVAIAPYEGSISVKGNRIEWTIAPGLEQPLLFIWEEGDEPRFVRLGKDRTLVLLEALRLPAQLQLLASDARGPRPVAWRWLGAAPALEAHLIRGPEALAQLRRERSLAPLRLNRILARAAAHYAQEICGKGRLTHINASGGPEERLRLEGIEARHVSEVLARARSAEKAWEALLRSPSHRFALLDRRMTDFGVGEAQAGDFYCVVVWLAAWPRYLGPSVSS